MLYGLPATEYDIATDPPQIVKPLRDSRSVLESRCDTAVPEKQDVDISSQSLESIQPHAHPLECPGNTLGKVLRKMRRNEKDSHQPSRSAPNFMDLKPEFHVFSGTGGEVARSSEY